MTKEDIVVKLTQMGWEAIYDGSIISVKKTDDPEILMEVTDTIVRIYLLPEQTEKFTKVTAPIESVVEKDNKLYLNVGTKRDLIPIDFLL